MSKEKILFTSESVSEGHPDKVCDRIADRILDAYLAKDHQSHVACEVFATGNFILVGGEITSPLNVDVDIEHEVKEALKEIGYDRAELGTDYHTVQIMNKIKKQSPDINLGLSQPKREDLGAGDQGIMFGYATDESDGYMPLAISIAHKLVREATRQRKEGLFIHSRPDMKSQVTIDYTQPDNIRIDSILMSCQHEPDIDMDAFRKYIHEQIMIPVAKSFHLNVDFKYYINPTGSFVMGGPLADTGLTGRKIIVDTYGGTAEHGGGSFSGKDATKVDRSGAYMARYIAKNLVAAGVAKRLLVQLSYGIGMNEPLSIGIKTYHTSRYDDETILSIIRQLFDCRPGMIIDKFHLDHPSFKYCSLSSYGHFGRPDVDVPWEHLDKVDEIQVALKKQTK